jgi:ATP-dependent DNA helicase DinG
LTAEFEAHGVWRAGLSAALVDLLRETELLNDSLRIIRERHEGEREKDALMPPLFNELRGVGRRLQTAGDGLRASLSPAPDAAPSVRWVEVRGKDHNVAISAVPLDLAPVLREDLFERVTTAVITSATLTSVGDAGFAFLSERLGVSELETAPATAIFPSPFDYARQSVLAVPTDIPAPNVNATGHFEAAVEIVRTVAAASDGGMFVLCTSHRDVRDAARVLRSEAGCRWPLLVHGEDARDALLRRFRDSGCGLLLGTASFWEGVDVPGDALRALVIVKIPFRVPAEPVTAAHCEAITARGGDAFTEYMLPHASLRLKQGFGRLIRSATDRGVVVIADPRMATKAYGRVLLGGLPPARRVVAPWATVKRVISDFYQL